MPWRKGGHFRALEEQEARGRTREIYDDIKQQLGVPLVSPVFQAYAAFPTFLELFWEQMRPAVQAAQFYSLGDRLRADGYTRMHNYFQIPTFAEAFAGETGRQDLDQVQNLVKLFHYMDPLLLLMLMALTQAFAKAVGHVHAKSGPIEHPVLYDVPHIVSEQTAPPQVKAIYADIKHTFGTQILSSAYQAMGSFPVFLESYWKALKPIAESALYSETHAGIRQTAWSLAREFPAQIELPLDDLAPENEVAGVARITEMFIESLSRTVLNVALAKIGLEHGTSRVSAPIQSRPPQAA